MSKREKIDQFIRRAVAEQLRESSFLSDELRTALKSACTFSQIVDGVAYNIHVDPYRMKELQDIMDWKQSPKIK